MRGATALLVAADVALAGLIYATVSAPAEEEVVPGPSSPWLPPVQGSAAPAAERGAAVAAILERPLFSPSRRPPEVGAVPAAAPVAAPRAELPRMTAILVDGTRRAAIFAGSQGKPVVVSEGGHVGAFTVERIERQQVVVTGPEGRRVVHTSFEMNPAPAMPVLPPGMPLTEGMPPPGPLTVLGR